MDPVQLLFLEEMAKKIIIIRLSFNTSELLLSNAKVSDGEKHDPAETVLVKHLQTLFHLPELF